MMNELFKLNFVRGCGLFVRSMIRAQEEALIRPSIYAALVSIINPWMEVIGEIIAKHVISLFRRQFKCNDKTKCLPTTKFIAHLVNQNVVCIVKHMNEFFVLLFFSL